MKQKFFIVDVFAEEKYAGNQLAVFLEAENLSSPHMQRIAFETNFSETTFISTCSNPKEGFDVRIFTPKEEIPFAGHPTLGTAFVIREEILKQPAQEIVLNLKAGKIPVTYDENLELFKMRQNPPVLGEIFEKNELTAVLSLDAEDMDSRFPIQAVSTGLPTIIVPLKSLKSLQKIKVDKQKYFALVTPRDPKLILAFSPEGYETGMDLSVRVFVDFFGIPEDPATGSGNGCLAGYLVQHNYFGENKIQVCTGQGYEIDRPSKLYLEANKSEKGIAVFVGGKVQKVAEGVFV